MGFAADLKVLCDRAGEKAELVVRGAALELASQMIDRSPVDTGRFKNNWIPSIGAALNPATTSDLDKSGEKALSAIRQSLDGWKPGQKIWITNSLPYAMKLEYGHSKQAANGMVRLAVQNYSEAVKRAADQVRNS